MAVIHSLAATAKENTTIGHNTSNYNKKVPNNKNSLPNLVSSQISKYFVPFYQNLTHYEKSPHHFCFHLCEFTT